MRYEVFIQLVRLGINYNSKPLPIPIEWGEVKSIADQHGLTSIVLDGIDKLPTTHRPPQNILLNWIGESLQQELDYSIQQKETVKIAELFHKNNIRMYILKGFIVSECYIKPNHRLSSDIDCYLIPDKGDFDAWQLGNDLFRERGAYVDLGFYKNSSIYLPGLLVEIHKYLTPFRGNKKLKALEILLQSLLHMDKGNDKFEESYLYRPPVMVTALFLIEHAYSHFLHEGLTWRMVLDWMMFSMKHQEEIDWVDFNSCIDKFGFRKFYDSYMRLGQYLLGVLSEKTLTKIDRLMLDDIWAPLDLHETVRGIKGKLALAGNTWRARWKYRYFTEMSWITALWIQVKGFLFVKKPKLD